MNKQIRIKSILGIFFCTIMTSCANYKTVSDEQCEILTDKSLLSIKSLLEKSNDDTLALLDFTMDYSRKGFYLIDKTNEKEFNFSDKYFDVHIKFCDTNFVVLYCPVSGIMNGLTLFPLNHNDLFIINRKLGKKVLDIQSKQGGIMKAVIKDSIIFFEYYEPNIVRYIKVL